ncbi:MAG: hypothetical protein K9N51_13555, partial [Candidatus Pacebacteria bacterium]|nr:hypothetical protein [Candidatus Paceibacterota bacterium]
HRAYSVAFAPDGTRVAVAGEGGTAFVFDVHNGRKVSTLACEGRIWDVAFAHGGKVAAGATTAGTVVFWDVNSGKKTDAWQVGDAAVQCVCFSPDGTRVLCGTRDGRALLWSMQGGAPAWSVPHLGPAVQAVDFSRDGKYMLTAAGDALAVWSVEELRVVRRTVLPGGHANAAAFASRQETVLAGNESGLWGWETGLGQESFSGRMHVDAVHAMVNGPGARLFSGGDDGNLVAWNTQSIAIKSRFPAHPGRILDVMVDRRNGRLLTASRDHTIAVWGLTDLDYVASHRLGNCGVMCMAEAADGHVFCGLENGKLVELSADESKTISRWQGHRDAVTAVVAVDSARRIFTAGEDGWIRVWDTIDHALVAQQVLHSGRPVFDLAVAEDQGYAVSAGGDGTIQVWRATDLTPLHVLHGHTGEVRCVAFSKDGSRTFSGGEDRTVRIWHTETGQELLTLRGHKAPVTQVALDPDTHCLVSADATGTVMFWPASEATTAADVIQGNVMRQKEIARTPSDFGAPQPVLHLTFDREKPTIDGVIVQNIEFVPGVKGRAARFGSGAYLMAPTAKIMDFTQGAFECWFALDNVHNERHTLFQLLEAPRKQWAFQRQLSLKITRDRSLAFTGTVSAGDLQADNMPVNLQSEATVAEGKWYHVVLTWENASPFSKNSSATLYLNGAEVAETAAEGSLPLTSGYIGFGAKIDNHMGEDSDITLDEVKLYSRKLSTKEAQALYTDRKNLEEP